MNKSIKKILKYGIIFFIIGVTLYISNELFIRNWRIERSEVRVKKSIKANFQKNEQKIKELKEFLLKLNMKPETTIEFYNGNIIQGYCFNENSISFSLEPDENNKIGNTELTKFVEYIGISEYELKSLGNQIEKVNCIAISVHNEKAFSLTYEGFSLYQCEYYFANNTDKSRQNHEKLDEGIYSGIYDSGLFCGWMMFNK
jgi:hypothetical protein